MISGTLIDVLLGLVLLSYAVSGLRHGFVVSALSLGGFLAGGALAMILLPSVLGWFPSLEDHPAARVAAVLGVVFLLAALGQGFAVALGHRLRPARSARALRGLDSFAGLVVVLVATSVLVWFVAGALRASPLGPAVGDSRILSVIDRVVPPQTARLFVGFRDLLDREGFPRVFEGIRREPIVPVPAPDPAVAGSAAIAGVADSVVKVVGTSDACHQGQEGSGWVVSRDRVVTNAHVVAGLDTVRVQPEGRGPTHRATVVVFDPERDLAVLSVPGLGADPIPQGADLGRGASAVVAGFPLNGPYDLRPARVRQVLIARGADIYGSPGPTREVYSLNTLVREGNSGGPLLDGRGEVVGVVFAKSLDDASTGYALTLREAAPVLRRAASASSPVPTGGCLTR